MSEWKKYKWGDLATLEYGKGLGDYLHEDGKYPVYGTNGRIGTTDNFLCPFPSIVVGRKGAYRGIHYSKTPFYVIDTAFYLNPKIPALDMTFAYYQLLTVDINYMDSGSAIPSTSREDFYYIDIALPPIEEQLTIASILSSLDDKIDLLHRQNKTLEQLAETLFRQWFVVEADSNWKIRPLGELVTVKRGGSPRPIQDYLSDSGLRWLKISDATKDTSPYIFEIKEHIKEEGLNKTTFLKKGSLVLSNSATPGIPKILQVDTCIHDGWLHFPHSHFSNEFLYLLFKSIRQELIQQGNGSIFTNLKTDILKEYPIPIADDKSLQFFNEQVQHSFDKILKNQIQIRTLTQLRDTLLPKLMSGVVRVK